MIKSFFTSLFSTILPRRKQQTVASRHGRIGEQTAVSYLRNKGIKVLARNWRYERDEIDIVCKDGQTLIFVEVKTRESETPFDAFFSVDRRKKNALRRAIKAYLKQEKDAGTCYRFDIIVVRLSQGCIKDTHHYENCRLK